MRAQRQGASEHAEQLCLEVLDLAPGQVDALAVLYRIRRDAGAVRTAAVLLRRIVAIDPNIFWATNELTLMLMASGNLAEAEVHARNAVRIAPENPQAHNLMGMVLTEAQRPQMGEFHYRQALRLSGARDPILLANLAWSLKSQGRIDEARALYRESTAAAPRILQTLLGWARLEEVDRKFDAAASLLRQAEAVAPNDPTLLYSRAVLLGRMRHHDEAIAALDGLSQGISQARLGPAETLEKGRLLDKMGRYDEAFAAFSEGKRLARDASGDVYMAEHADALVRRLRGFFTQSRLAILPRAGVRTDVPQPIFITGFPRSGTTLVEQTLSVHPAISAGDELPLVAEIAAIMPRMFDSPVSYPEALAELWMADHHEGLDNLRDFYLQKARQLGAVDPAKPRFTDKMPLNETHLGLIALMFPLAPVIHVVRHPLDVVLSVFSNFLTHGFFCAAALETAARHYALIMELVLHYRSQMNIRYHQVRYEDMVDRQSETVSALLAFLGEGFDERCLRFHDNQRYARTASYAQVTEQLYDRSRFRYRHYLKHLEPVIPILAPVIERLGYSVERGLP